MSAQALEGEWDTYSVKQECEADMSDKVVEITKPSNVVPFRQDGAPVAKIANAVVVKNSGSAIDMFGEVGWDIRAQPTIEKLKAMNVKGETVFVDLTSGGGDLFEGYAIGNYIASMDATVVVRVGALAASIASYIACCASKVVMPKNSMMMIHEVKASVHGTADEISNVLELMGKMNDQIAASYEAKRVRTHGQTDGAEPFRPMMKADCWLTAEEALALGLCDEVVDAVAMVACVRPDFAAQISVPESIKNDVVSDEDIIKTPDDIEADDAEKEAEEAKAQAEAAAAAEQAAAEAAALAAAEAEAATKLLAETAAAEAAAAAQLEADIRATCRVFGAEDKADGFISNKVDFAEVRKALWKAKADADAALETDSTAPPAENQNKDTYSDQAEKIRNSYNAALRGTHKGTL